MRTLLLSLSLLVMAACTVEEAEPVAAQRAALRDLDAVEQEFLRLLNDYRTDNGRGEVMADRSLNEGARDYSQLMGETSHFDHTGPDGSRFFERMCDAGYEPGCGPSTFVSENIAAGQWTAAAVFEAWRESPGHNENMLDGRAVVVGIGRAEVSGSPYGVYWTNTFGGQTTAHTVPNDVDAGPLEQDAGTVEQDAGTTVETDAGVPDDGTDAGAGAGSDAGDEDDSDASILFPGADASAGGDWMRASPGGSLRGGCAVATGSAGGPPATLLGLIALAFVIRKRSR